MGYVELLRLRNGLTICVSILCGLAAFALFLAWVLVRTHAITGDVNHVGGVGLSVLVGLAAYPAAGFTTGFGWSLNNATENAQLLWTRPISRVRLALTYLGLDAAVITLVFLFALGLYVLVVYGLRDIIGFPRALQIDEAMLPGILVGIGVPFMWFGLVQAATAFNRLRGGMVAGLSWPVFFILAWLIAVKLEPFHTIIAALNFLNPLAYKDLSGFVDQHMSSFTTTFHSGLSVVALGLWPRAALTWTIGAIGCAIAIAGWKRVEL